MRRWSAMAMMVLAMTVGGCRERASTALEDGHALGADVGPLLPPLTEGFVVLPWGTRVYVEPRVGGPSARLGSAQHMPSPWPPTGIVVRVVGEREGFVEVAPLLGEERRWRHCGPSLDGEGLDVRFFVSPWAPAWVLTRTHEQVDDEGHFVSLRPGAVVRRIPGDSESKWAISAGGVLLSMPLPIDAVGRSYVGPESVTGTSWAIEDGLGLSLGGRVVALDRMFGEVSIGTVEPDDDGGHWVELRSPCAWLIVHAQRKPTPPLPEPPVDFFEFGLGAPDVMVPSVPLVEGLGLAPVSEQIDSEPGSIPIDFVPEDIDGIPLAAAFGLLGPERFEWMFEEGAPVYLSLGGPAVGRLDEQLLFPGDAWLAGDRLCFHTPFGARFVPPLPVCLDGLEGRLHDPQKDGQDFRPRLVRPVSLHIRGGLDRAAVEREMRLHRRELRRCASTAIAATLALTFDVDHKGRTGGVEVHASKRLGAVEGCVKAAADDWVLPPPTDGREARVTLTVEIAESGSGGGVG